MTPDTGPTRKSHFLSPIFSKLTFSAKQHFSYRYGQDGIFLWETGVCMPSRSMLWILPPPAGLLLPAVSNIHP